MVFWGQFSLQELDLWVLQCNCGRDTTEQRTVELHLLNSKELAVCGLRESGVLSWWGAGSEGW